VVRRFWGKKNGFDHERFTNQDGRGLGRKGGEATGIETFPLFYIYMGQEGEGDTMR